MKTAQEKAQERRQRERKRLYNPYDRKNTAGMYEHQKEVEETPGANAKRNSYYHKFFEGYSEVQVPRKNGKGMRIERRYVGSYYRRDCSDSAWTGSKILYAGIFAVSSVLYLTAAGEMPGGMSALYVVAPELVTVLLLVAGFMYMGRCLCAGRKMKIYEYKSSYAVLPKICLGTMAAMAATAALSAIDTALHWSEYGASGLECCALELIAMLGFGGIWLLESQTQYITVPNSAKPFESGVVIQ